MPSLSYVYQDKVHEDDGGKMKVESNILFELENVLVEVKLEVFIGCTQRVSSWARLHTQTALKMFLIIVDARRNKHTVVDAELLEAVGLEVFEPKDIENANGVLLDLLVDNVVDTVHKPWKPETCIMSDRL